MKIALAGDHAGVKLKKKVESLLQKRGVEIINLGTDDEARVDYPDYGHAVADALSEGEAKFGIVICGSGNGINMTVNKHPGIRSALCWNLELAQLARQHNDANVLALPARFISEEEGLSIVNHFLDANFEGGRHERRVRKING